MKSIVETLPLWKKKEKNEAQDSQGPTRAFAYQCGLAAQTNMALAVVLGTTLLLPMVRPEIE